MFDGWIVTVGHIGLVEHGLLGKLLVGDLDENQPPRTTYILHTQLPYESLHTTLPVVSSGRMSIDNSALSAVAVGVDTLDPRALGEVQLQGQAESSEFYRVTKP